MPLVEPCTEPNGWTRYYDDTYAAGDTYDYESQLTAKCAPNCFLGVIEVGDCDAQCLTSWCNWSDGMCSESSPARERGANDQLVMLWAQNRNTCRQFEKDEYQYDYVDYGFDNPGVAPQNVTVETYRTCDAPCCQGLQVVDARCRVTGTGVPVEQLPFGHLITCSPVGLQCWDEDIAAWAAENGGSTQACPSLEISWRCAPPPPPLPPFPPPFPPPGN